MMPDEACVALSASVSNHSSRKSGALIDEQLDEQLLAASRQRAELIGERAAPRARYAQSSDVGSGGVIPSSGFTNAAISAMRACGELAVGVGVARASAAQSRGGTSRRRSGRHR